MCSVCWMLDQWHSRLHWWFRWQLKEGATKRQTSSLYFSALPHHSLRSGRGRHWKNARARSCSSKPISRGPRVRGPSTILPPHPRPLQQKGHPSSSTTAQTFVFLTSPRAQLLFFLRLTKMSRRVEVRRKRSDYKCLRSSLIGSSWLRA